MPDQDANFDLMFRTDVKQFRHTFSTLFLDKDTKALALVLMRQVLYAAANDGEIEIVTDEALSAKPEGVTS